MGLGARLFLTIVMAAALGALIAGHQAATPDQQYEFTRIVSSSDSPYVEFDYPRINDAGAVVFQARLATGGYVLLTGTGPNDLRVVAATSAGDFQTFSAPGDVNRRGVVSYATGSEVRATYRGVTTTLASLADGFGSLMTLTAISDNNVVVFRGIDVEGSWGIYKRRLQSRSIVTVADQALGLVGLEGPAINEKGTLIAFVADTTNGVPGIYVAQRGEVWAVVDSTGAFYRFSTPPSVNNSGQIAFHATLDAGGGGVFVTDLAGNVRTVALGNTVQFDEARKPAINNLGQVVFEADVRGLGVGVYRGPDPVADKVISRTDVLDNEVLESVGFFDGLNDKGQIAFHAGFQSGHQAVYRADPVRGR